MSKIASRKKVLIIGAGFGGVAAARALKKPGIDVTLIDRTNHYLFQPLLYQVAAAALSPADIAVATRALMRKTTNVTVLMAEVVAINVNQQIVHFSNGDTLPYDYLILAVGAKYNFFGHNVWAAKTLVLKSLKDALSIREHLLSAFERAELCDDKDEVKRLLTFVIVGGGPTGVELAGTIAELTRSTLARDFKHIDPQQSRIVLCEAEGRLLSGFSLRLSGYAAKALKSLGVEVHLGKSVDDVDDTGLRIGKTRIEAATILWCAGTEAVGAAQWIDAKTAKNGAIIVEPNCAVPGHPEIFAIGDVACFKTEDGKVLPGLAPVAKQQGKYVASLIKAAVAHRPYPKRFHYRDLGTLAVIGRSRAVASLGSLQFTGFLAWLCWSLVHLMLLADFRSRLMVYINWSWAWITYGRSARLILSMRKRTNEK